MADAKTELKAPPKVEAKVTQLAPDRLKLAEHAQLGYVVAPEYDTPFEAVLNPAYWAHTSMKLKAGSLIQIIPEDMSYYARLLVVDAGRLFAKVFVLEHKPLAAANIFNVAVPEGWELKWRGPVRKWCVLRGTDEMASGMTKIEAERWLSDHMKAAA